MTIRPIGKKLLLSIVEKEETVLDGIVVKGHTRRDAVREAVVHALPNGYHGDLTVGDTVYVKPWCGTETVYGKTRLVFVREDEIMAAMEAE